MPHAYYKKPAIRCFIINLTLGLISSGFELSLTPALIPASLQKDLFCQFILVYIKECWNIALSKVQKPQENTLNRPVKAKNPYLYYKNLHIKYYYFC